jgi:glucosamine--fructose-6-phosphate aminotransferase (isomerizing)
MVKWQLFAHKSMKVRNIKDDSLVDPYIQELQMNLEQIEKGV